MTPRARFLPLLCLFALLSPSAGAQDTSHWRLHAHGDHIDVVDPAQPKALRLVVLEHVQATTRAQALDAGEAAIRRHTQASGFEVCAMLCQAPDGSRYGMTVVSARSHLGCPVFRICPDGLEATPEQTDLHSHGSRGRFRINRADAWLVGEPWGQMSRGAAPKFHFSAQDKLGAPAYLITPTGRKFSPGNGDIRPGPRVVSAPADRRCQPH